MSRQFIIISDCHVYGADPTCSPQELLDILKNAIIQAKKTGAIIVWAGDNVDIKNALDPYAADELYKTCYRMLENSGVKFVWLIGNHEDGAGTPLTGTVVIDDIIYHHGDHCFYGFDLAVKRRKYEPGCGHLMRFFKKIGSKYRNLTGWKITDKHADQLSNFRINKRPTAKLAICGHTHPKETQTFTDMSGCVHAVVPRGLTVYTEGE